MPGTGRTDLEIAALRGFISCATGSASAARGEFEELLIGLAGYVWADEEHRVVYECLRSAQGRRVVPLREAMAAEATRMGHPDVEWDVYFRSSSEGEGADLPELIRRLKNNPLNAICKSSPPHLNCSRP